ncbi:MAG TPA: transglycosylase SLT domain-containing protein [Bryobacteraceae bacterium]|nr:transglycosylase SLT domain-containing protein [Bryobacteraceae bacterium]
MIFCLKRFYLALGCSGLALLTGCAVPTAQRFGMSFLPPAPQPGSTPEAVEAPPLVASNKYLTQTSAFFKPDLKLPPRPSAIDATLRRSDEHFARGKQLYDAGDLAAARAEFDAAVDLLLGAPENAPDRHKIEARLEQLVPAIYKFDVNRLGAGDLSENAGWDKTPLEDILELTFPVDPQLKPRVQGQLQGTVSQLPLEINDAVLSYINYFSGERGRRTLLAGLRRAGRYKQLIQGILAEEGVPQELIYLAQAESGFLPRAVSHKAAVGMWQFVQARGRQYGLTQTRYSDDRLDPEKATRSAARHLRDLYKKFGDWYLAIAGYNCGDGCVERAVQRTGYADFWELRSRNAIPRETTNYVPIIVAITIMHKNAKDYGLDGIEVDAPLEWENLDVEAPTHLALIADAVDRPVSEIRDLNPALLSGVAPTGYQVHVPAGTKTQALATLASIPAEKRASWRIHRFDASESLDAIARRYRMSVQAIRTANGGSDPDAGDVLIIPTASEVERSVRARSIESAPASPSSRAGRSKKASGTKARSSTTASYRSPARRARGVQRASVR